MFILIIGEDWNWTMYTWVRAYGAGSTSNEVIATLFFIFIMIVGNIVLFSVFTAILLQNFEGGDEEEEQGEEEDEEDHDETPANEFDNSQNKSFAQRVCGAEAWENYADSFKKAFGAK